MDLGSVSAVVKETFCSWQQRKQLSPLFRKTSWQKSSLDTADMQLQFSLKERNKQKYPFHVNIVQQQPVGAYPSPGHVFKVTVVLTRISALRKRRFLCFICEENLKI